jgi:hypothetical protein
MDYWNENYTIEKISDNIKNCVNTL